MIFCILLNLSASGVVGQDRQLVRIVLGSSVLPYDPPAVDFGFEIV